MSGDARFCTCCGEPFRATMDSPLGGECACEWDGCDENCPAVGHLYATTKGGCNVSGDALTGEEHGDGA